MQEGGVLTPEQLAYIESLTPGDDEFLTELKREATSLGMDTSRMIHATQASLLQILLKLISAKRVLEIGTFAGYSAIAMARALPEDSGRVDTIEILDSCCDFAERWIARSNVSGRVHLHRGPACDILPKFADNSFDAAFIDAWKESYVDFLRESVRVVRPNGLIVADNAFAFGQVLDKDSTEFPVPAMRAFNEHMRLSFPNPLHGVIVPLGDACWVAVNQKG